MQMSIVSSKVFIDKLSCTILKKISNNDCKIAFGSLFQLVRQNCECPVKESGIQIKSKITSDNVEQYVGPFGIMTIFFVVEFFYLKTYTVYFFWFILKRNLSYYKIMIIIYN